MYAAASESAAIYSGAVLLAAISPHVARCVVAWIKGRFGRKVRLEIGDNGRIKAEAQSPEEVEKLVRTAKEYRKSVAKSPQKVKPRRSKPQK